MNLARLVAPARSRRNPEYQHYEWYKPKGSRIKLEIVKVVGDWRAWPQMTSFQVRGPTGTFISGLFESAADARRWVDQAMKQLGVRDPKKPQFENPRKRQRVHQIFLHPYLLDPKVKDQLAKTYGLPKNRIKTMDDLAPRYQKEAQSLVTRLAKEDGIKPPTVKVDHVHLLFPGGASPAYYQEETQTIYLDTSYVAWTQAIVGGKCRPAMRTLLHEYRHHQQFETDGGDKINKTYEKEGPVGWDGHKYERDADAYADANCPLYDWRGDP